MYPEPAIPLLPGERRLWQGSPDPGKLFIPADAFLIPFYGFFLVFATFFLVGSLLSGAPIFVLAFSSLFVVFGVYVTVGRFLVKAIRKSRTTYLVTDRRAIIHTPWSTREVRLNTAGIELISRGSGRHLTVIFTDPTVGRRGGTFLSQRWANEQFRNSGMEMFGGWHSPAFYDVADADGLRAVLEPFLNHTPQYQDPAPYGT